VVAPERVLGLRLVGFGSYRASAHIGTQRPTAQRRQSTPHPSRTMGNSQSSIRGSQSSIRVTQSRNSGYFEDFEARRESEKSIGTSHDLARLSPEGGNYKRRRVLSAESQGDFGWFEDTESPALSRVLSSELHQPLHRALALLAPVSEPPMYVLESTLETQQLWYSTAGRRPQQPEQEREYFEKLWSKNFEQSEINHQHQHQHQQQHQQRGRGGVFIPTSPRPGRSQESPKADEALSIRVQQAREVREPPAESVHFRGNSPFSFSKTKTFHNGISSMTVQLPCYRVRRDDTNAGKLLCEYLVVVSGVGAVTFGVWKRHSDFAQLATKLTRIDEATLNSDNFDNSLLSWRCVLERKRWFKSLDPEYLSLKCFLLERFMHDLLFECPAPSVIHCFLGLQAEPVGSRQ
jgi:hypothetical protein